jgi:hypothetical protein
MNDRLFQRVIEAVARFDTVDLLTAVAALQVMPVNISRTVRLEVLAHAIATQAVDTKGAKPSLDDLRRLCNNEPLASFEITRSEDPPEWHFVEPMTWRGGSFLVFPGIADDSAFSFRHLAQALNVPPEFDPHPAFISDANRLIRSVLRLSTEVARRARLKRWTNPRMESHDTIVPSSLEELDHLKNAVLFRKTELDELLQAQGGSTVLQHLTSAFGVNPQTYNRHNGALLAAPLVQHADSYIVALPGLLLDATRHQLISRAINAGAIDDVGRRFADAMWSTVDESLQKLGMSRESRVVPFPEIPNARGAIYQFDNDKYAHVVLITDPFRDYRPDTVFGHWSLEPFQGAIEARVNRTAAAAERSDSNTIMTLIVVQGAGSEHHVHFGMLPDNTLALRASELETVSYAEGGQPLALWKFVQARERIGRVIHVHATSMLDEFEMYRPRHSFYFSDDAPPNLLSVEVGTGFGTRKHVADRYDVHAEPIETGNGTSLVVKMIDASVPVYADIGRAQHRVAFFVDGLPVRLWIVGPENITGQAHPGRDLRSLNFDLVQGLAYWFWQFTPGLVNHLRPAAGQNRLTIRLDLPATILDATQHQGGEPFFETAIDAETLIVRFLPSAVPLFTGTDNEGERALMTSVLSGLAQMPIAAELDEQTIVCLVDEFAPRGSKKQVFFLNLDRSPDLDWTDLPDDRLMQKGDIDALLDDLGEHLRTEKGRSTGKIASADRAAVLHQCVEYFYNLLRDEVAALTPRGTLEHLVRRHEVLIQQTAFRALTVPTRLACFGDIPDMVTELESEIPERARTAIASRFLIEYVAATPSQGNRELSVATFDRLLAIAHHITNFGFSSDLLHFRLADTQLAILGSGRLGIERDAFSEGLKAYMSAYTSDVRSRSVRDFERHWRRGEGAGSSTVMDRLKGPSEAEFGASLAEFFDLMIGAVDIPRHERSSVGVMSRPELVGRLADRLSWSPEKVGGILDQLTTARREGFLAPPAPFRPADVYPWKFGRRLSYLRRPFLQIEHGGEPKLLWGMRHLFHSTGYLAAICINGRLSATTSEMRSAMSELNDERGYQFNVTVAAVLKRDDRIVEPRKRTFGSLKMPGELGDLDVLVIEPARHRVAVIECKDLALARTPQELANQLEGLTGITEDTQGAATARHARRLNWVRENLSDVLAHFGIENADGWEVIGMFVVDEPLFATHLRDIGMEVRSLESLHANPEL